jgi:hypothetical protein
MRIPENSCKIIYRDLMQYRGSKWTSVELSQHVIKIYLICMGM